MAAAPELAARQAALDILTGVTVARRAVDDTFDAAVTRLEPRDRAFVRLLVATALRRLGQIDAVLAAFIPRRPPDLIRDILRLGAAQLLFIATPPHAAVATTVALARARGHERMTGLVNAVMRRVVAEGQALIAGHDAARLNTADWMWHSWAAAYGPEAAHALALAHLTEPPLDFSLKPEARAADWAATLEAVPLRTGSLRRFAAGRVPDLPGFGEGLWWVQDAAAALPAKILLASLSGSSARAGSHPEVADLCAAPGGKTAQLAAAGCAVTAVDLSPERVRLLGDNLARLALPAVLVPADVLAWKPETLADAVLLDAPCSATGTLRRHPDLPHLKQEGDIAGFAQNQRRLLSAALAMVKPGGQVVYSVCSLEPEEGPDVVASVLAEDRAVTRIPISAEMIGAPELVNDRGELRTLPSHWAEQGGMDGFYAALLRRRA